MATCSIKDCERKAFSRSFCTMHYARWRKWGDPTALKQTQLHGKTLEERFWARVRKTSGCWTWDGSRDSNGYGRINKNGRPALAHRISWELSTGRELERDQHVCHKCDYPPCVRPDHLFLGDPQANTDDKMRKGRHKYGTSKGEKHGCAKLTEQQVLAIRASFGPSRIIAEQYGISGRQVRDIRRKRVWRHI